jgi:hypothetical protein
MRDEDTCSAESDVRARHSTAAGPPDNGIDREVVDWLR